MLDKNVAVALVVQNSAEVDLFTMSIVGQKFRNVTAFTSTREAYEVAVRHQFGIFVTRMEMPDMNGIVFLQKIRETGNYGHETHLFVCDKLDPAVLSILYEHDISYVMVKPFTKQTVAAKFTHLLAAEAALTDFEKLYRDARSALYNGIAEMAEDFGQRLLQLQPQSDKALVLLGDVAIKRGDTAAATKLYEQARVANPKSPVPPHKLAQIRMQAGDFAGAAALINALADLNPYHIKVLENAGISNLKCNNIEKAEQYSRALTKADTTNHTATEVNANCQIARGNFDSLAETLRSTHDERQIVSFLNNAGVKLSQSKDIAGALRMYGSALRQLEGSKYAYAIHYNMGLAYKKLGKASDAAQSFRASVKLKPDFDKAAAALKDIEAA